MNLQGSLVHVTIPAMIIGDRIRLLRETKKLSQGDIEKRTGLLRCYISRVENGHTVPAIETLEKLARAMEVPLYQLFYDGEEPPELPNLPKRKSADDIAWGSTGKEARFLGRFRRLLGRIEEGDRRLLLYIAQKMDRRSNSPRPSAQKGQKDAQPLNLPAAWFVIIPPNIAAAPAGTPSSVACD